MPLQEGNSIASEAQGLIDRVIDMIGAKWLVSLLVALGIILIALGKGVNALKQIGQMLSTIVGFRRKAALSFLSRSAIEYSQTEFLNRVVLGDLQTISKFIAAGMDVNTPDSTGRVALIEAVKSGHTSVVSILLDNAANTAGQDSEGLTAMDVAANTGSQEVAWLLLRAGADLDVKTPFALDLWCHASKTGRLEDVQFLLERGFDSDLAKCNGNSGAALAARGGHLETMKTILLASMSPSSLIEPVIVAAAEGDHIEILRWLMGEQIQEEDRDRLATAALRAACKANHLESAMRKRVVSFLLSVGADPDGSPRMVKHYHTLEVREPGLVIEAATRGFTEVVEQLTAAKIDVNQVDHQEMTPLMYATVGGYLHTVDALIKAGADPNRQQYLGMTALMLAVTDFRYPFKKASEDCLLEIVNRLLDAGANAEIRDEKGLTAIDYARKEGYRRIADRIAIEMGPDQDD